MDPRVHLVLAYRPPPIPIPPGSTPLREEFDTSTLELSVVFRTLMSNRPLYNVSRVQNANFGYNSGIINQGARIGQQTINLFSVSAEELVYRLNPILDASHTRNRKRSPPDSECFPGTREEPIRDIIVWADCGEVIHVCTNWHFGSVVKTFLSATAPPPPPLHEYRLPAWGGVREDSHSMKTPHIYWLHGFAGSGKSSISLEVAKIYAGSGRLLASYFFFRGAGDRSTMNRFAVTLASQLVSAIPATAPLIHEALRADPGLATGEVSFATQLDLLVLSPFQTVLNTGALEEACAKGPFFIVVDGLDECEDKQGVEEFIDHMVAFFKKHPSIPLRLFIASRVEQHIRERLEIGGVQLGNLDSHTADRDIKKYLQASFQVAAKRNRVIRAYVEASGEWPVKSDLNELIKHIGGSFVLASAIIKFIVQPATAEDPSTPMERLPLALKMNGLDGLYAQTLARSQHLPHFRNIISSITLLRGSLPIVGIASLLHIQTFELVHVLLNLQAIIHVPGTDDQGEVTLCHTSLRDFLTTQSRSRSFFVPPSFNLCLAYYLFDSKIEMRILGHGHARPFTDYLGDGYLTTPNAIEQFKVNRSMFVGRVPSHAFLCSMFWYTILNPLLSEDIAYLFNECAQHLALAVECPDSSIRLWLWRETFSARFLGRCVSRSATQLTEQTHEALQRVSTVIRARFPEYLAGQYHPTEEGSKCFYTIRRQTNMSGIEIFKALQWVVARARYIREEAKITPHHPLKFIAFEFADLHLSFDVAGNDDIESSDSGRETEQSAATEPQSCHVGEEMEIA